MTKYTVLDFAEEVLRSSDKPLVYQEIWDRGKAIELEKKLASKGKTPWQTLGARLFVDIRDNPNSQFIKVGKNPARFFLKERQRELTEEQLRLLIEKEQQLPTKPKKFSFPERKLHALLSYFTYANVAFNRGKQIYTKTIHHEKSKKKQPSEWVYPDVVGFYLPLNDWDDKLIEFNKKVTAASSIRLYSFEIKIRIDKTNYRECFFQSVSNSSWSNEGYLVTSSLQQQDDLLSELERLSTSFGIGLIHLDLEDIDASKVVFPAKTKETLDWELMNKLCEQNGDFRNFIDSVRKDYEVNTIHKGDYDEIPDDPEKYIKQMIKEGRC
jgi:uncharacterized protein